MGAVVQSNFSASGTPSLAGVTAGNCLILINDYYRSGNNSTANIATPTDSGGTLVATRADTATPVVDQTANTFGVGIWYEKNCAAGTHNVSVSPGTGTSSNNAYLIEVSGLDTTAPLDVTAINSGGGSTTQSRTSGTTAAIAQTNSIAFAAVGMVSTVGQANIAITNPPTGYTTIYVENNSLVDVGAEFAYKNGLSAGTQSVTWSWTDATTSGSLGTIAVFKDSGAPPASTQQSLMLMGVGP